MRSWFQQHGYDLYTYRIGKSGQTSHTYPQKEFKGVQEWPFAHLGGDRPDDEIPDFASWAGFNGRVQFAQDSQGRHVAIKLVKGDSDEYKINRLLNERTSTYTGVIPVLALLPYDGHWFVVMPRWGPLDCAPWFSSMAEKLNFMKCYLEGLAFLHEHRIFHRVDITWLNALINHLPNRDIIGLKTNPIRKQLRAEGRLSYALFDFNLSIMLPLGKPLLSYLLPIEELREPRYDFTYIEVCLRETIEECIPGVPDKLWGVIWESELDFNPFAYDVGRLGVRFADSFQYFTPLIPMLAPLLDGMLTSDIEKRFTAAEGFSFLETFHSQLDSETLAQQPIARSLVTWKHWDRWKGLPDEFVRQWDAYRILQPSFRTRFVRKEIQGGLCCY